ncbi:B3/4 domain-containing protein [Streptococcus iniae]|uniref:B3/B4 domain-containing protein n=1 Tax=Streptococcus iniae TaxID=1346 RepID=UPI002B2BBDA6|nr:B3/4 domain-containing protein [Streptococcus iniae]WNZ90333.1 B3/4 domain-containing protein [Streptococcus iniae]WNZ91975.1 B3/4 domain-containing protein [Streptococcus iniae]WNZ93383.1 B3/4 domain-containing protein [Streptococcus iniae]WNZ94609.1 B3/4 domain-containing protein [Streptococcus iniae]
MTLFIADDSFWDLFPDAQLGVILLKNYQAEQTSPIEIKRLLRDSHDLALKHLPEDNFTDNQVIQTYRKAYQQFKTKKGVRSSIEALLKRVNNGQEISSINPLVDIYNATSLRFGLPVGAEDRDTFVGDLRLTITEGGDAFYLIGDDNNSPTLPNELCYKDDKGAVCRCLNWRDGERTMIRPETTNAFLIIELLDPNKADSLQEALSFIEENSKTYLKAKTQVEILTQENPTINL